MSETFDPNSASGCDTLFGIPCEQEQAGVIVLPVPFDATASYRKGAAGAPRNVLEASWQVDLRDVDTGDPWREGIAMLPLETGLADEVRVLNDEGRALMRWVESDERDGCDEEPVGARQARERLNAIGETLRARVSEEASVWLDKRKLVVVLGGEHSCPLGLIEQLAARHPGLGVLHIDAHADLRNAYQGLKHSHASIMHNVLQVPGVEALTQVAVRDLCAQEMELIDAQARVTCYYDADLTRRQFEGETYGAIVREIVQTLPQQVYVSFDIDGLEPALCPGTGTPVPGGLTFQQACYLLRQVVVSGRRIVGCDLCEVGMGQMDGIVGARVLYKLIGSMLCSVPRSAF